MSTKEGRDRVRGLYAIADTSVLAPDQLLPAVQQAIAGGAAVIQFRDKGDNSALRLQQAQALADLCRENNVVFIINDDAALAQVVDADGVHLGRDDPGLAGVRELLGPGALIGVSCYNEIGRARNASDEGADYVAFGSFYPSNIKPDAVRASTELLHQASEELELPVVAIGGITPENGAELVAAGADALAVITGIFTADDISKAAQRYAALFEQKY
jgi:thiamine-phosphate pyrophosphorylase